ncbi:hypothetical protein SLA2020_275610 [Shorea laevis]
MRGGPSEAQGNHQGNAKGRQGGVVEKVVAQKGRGKTRYRNKGVGGAGAASARMDRRGLGGQGRGRSGDAVGRGNPKAPTANSTGRRVVETEIGPAVRGGRQHPKGAGRKITRGTPRKLTYNLCKNTAKQQF